MCRAMEFGCRRGDDCPVVRVKGDVTLSDRVVLTIETSDCLYVELDMQELARIVLWAREKMAEEAETKEE